MTRILILLVLMSTVAEAQLERASRRVLGRGGLSRAGSGVAVDTTRNFYVSNTGSDDSTGLTSAKAWKTLAKVNAQTLWPGDSVFFKKGDTWKEQLTAPFVGTAAKRIVFTTYGTGDSPAFDGADTVTGWSNDTTWNFQVAGELDDACSISGYNDNSGGGVSLSSDAVAWGSGFRFQNIPIAKSTTITSAVFQAYAYTNDIATTMYGEAADSAKNFDDANPYAYARSHTSASVAWSTSVGGWISRTVTACVQEIINRTGWKSGNSLALVTQAAISTNGVVYSYGGAGGGVGAKLSITAPSGGNKYSASVSWGARGPTLVWRDGALGTHVESVTALTADGHWYYDSGNSLLYIYSSDAPSGHVIEASRRDYGVNLTDARYVTVDSLRTTRANMFGVLLDTAQCVTLTDMDVDWNSSSGIIVQNGSLLTSIVGGMVHDNGHSSNGTSSDDCNGIGLGGEGIASTYTTISGVTIKKNVADAISCYVPSGVATDSANVIIRYCVIDSTTSGSGIRFDGKGQWTLIHHNVIYGNSLTGIQHGDGTAGSGSTRIDIFHNSVYGNTNGGITMGGATSVLTFKNNIVHSNGDAWNGFDMNISASLDSLASDYNIFYDPAEWEHNTNMYLFGTGNMTLSDWKTATSGDAHSLGSDPLFTNTATADFTLQNGSPAINAGVVIVGMNDGYLGVAPDIGRHEKQ